MPDEARLPELARSLRALGAAHGDAAEAAHAAVFGPLLDARARAESGGIDGAIAVFRGQALAARIAARTTEAARDGVLDPARGRARVARAREALEPLRDALHVLDALTPAHSADVLTSTSAAAAWTAQLARAFRLADEACVSLARVLAEHDDVPAPRGWLGRFGR
jgi:O-acetyl-ADP-ribose deacetylase (regulator of RNase III)